MIELNNPAGRAQELLSRTLRFASGNAQRDAWGAAFELPIEDTLGISRKLLILDQTLAGIELRIATIEDVTTRELYWRPIRNIREAVAKFQPQEAWAAVQDKINSAAIAHLEHVSRWLSTTSTEETVPKERLTELRTKISDARIWLDKTPDLPKELQELVRELLRRIDRALDEYFVRGVEGLREARNDILGAVVDRIEVIRSAPPTVMQRVRECVQTLSALVVLGDKVSQHVSIDDVREVIGFLSP